MNSTHHPPGLANSPFLKFHEAEHSELINYVLHRHEGVSEGMRLVVCQMSIYYQSRINGVSHSQALRLTDLIVEYVQFDFEGIATC